MQREILSKQKSSSAAFINAGDGLAGFRGKSDEVNLRIHLITLKRLKIGINHVVAESRKSFMRQSMILSVDRRHALPFLV